MAAEITSRQRVVGVLQQTNFATPMAVTDNYETLNYNAGSVIFNPNTIINNFDVTSTSGLVPKESRNYTDTASGLKSMAFAGLATRKHLALHFVSALQNVTEEATTPFQKIITPVYNSTILDTSAAGYYHTLASYANSNSTDGVLLKTAVVGDMTFSLTPNAEGIARLAQISGNWIGATILANQDLSAGTWVAESLADFYNDLTACTINISGYTDLTGICFKNYSLQINNNVVSDCRTAGVPASYKFSPSFTVSVTLPYDSTTYSIFEDYRAGTVGGIELTSGSTGAAGFLNIISYGRLTATPHGTDGQYESIVLSQTVELNTAAAKSLQVTIADATDRSYPAP